MATVSRAVKGAQGAIVSFDTVEARTEHNVAVAALVMAAGVPVVPLKEQAPLALAFPRLDSTIGPAERAGIVAAWQAENGHTRAPFHVGSTIDGDRLNAWHSGRRDWTLSFGCSPGLVEAVVIDCDDEGGASLLAYLEAHGEVIDFARTPITVSGGRQGWHVWFANPGGKWGCPKIKPDITADVKGRGGQVLLPDMVLSPKLYGDTMSGPRHYRPLAGTPDLLDTLRAGTLPPLPACLAALMERNGGAEADPTDERSTHVRAALLALRGDPSPACMARDAMALVETLRGKDAAFDELWRQGDDDGSNGRFRVAQALLREYGSNGFEVHNLHDAFDEWDHAVKGNPITDREVARCYGKAVENFGTRNDGTAFGAVVDEDQVEDAVPPADPLRALLDAEVFGTTAAADAAQAALVAAVAEDGLSAKGKQRLAAQLDTIRGTGTAPKLGSYAEFAKWVREGDSKPAKPQAPKYESRAAVRARPATAVRWLVEGLIAAESLVLLHGREKTGKSFLGTDIAYSLAYGMAWAGRAVKRTGVIYVCPEGPHGFRLRQDAWHNRQAAIGNPVEDGPIEIRTVATDLFGSDEHLNEIAAQVRTFKDRHGIECGLVIFDTFRAVSPGADENSARDVGVVTNRMVRLRDLCACAVGLVHHDGKDTAKGAAGSTAFTANVDSVFATYRDARGLGFKPELQRDTEDLRGFRFTIETHDAREIGGKMERAGVAIIGAAVAGDDEAEQRPKGKAMAGGNSGEAFGAVQGEDGGLTPETQARRAMLLDVLRERCAELGGKGCARGILLDAFNAKRRAKGGENAKLGTSQFGELLADVVEAGLIRLVGAGRGAVYHLVEGVETTG